MAAAARSKRSGAAFLLARWKEAGRLYEPSRDTAGDAGSEHEAPAGERLLMSYGINDCEAKLAKMPMDKVWAMLRPLKGEEGVCA